MVHLLVGNQNGQELKWTGIGMENENPNKLFT